MAQEIQMDGEGEDHQQDQNEHYEKILSVDHIDQIWNAKNPLADLFHVYTSFFNPSMSHDYWQVDDNKIKFLAEFQIYNLIFCKNDLKLSDEETWEVLDIMWNLLAFNQDGTIQDHSVSAQESFNEALTGKFDELKNELIARAKQGILTKDQIKLIMTYMKSGYFKHFRLVDFVLRNSQHSKVKTITLFHDEPIKMSSLNNAKEIIEEPSHPQREAEGEYDAEGEDPLEGIDDRLNQANLDDDTKHEVKHKLQEYKKEAEAKVVKK